MRRRVLVSAILASGFGWNSASAAVAAEAWLPSELPSPQTTDAAAPAAPAPASSSAPAASASLPQASAADRPNAPASPLPGSPASPSANVASAPASPAPGAGEPASSASVASPPPSAPSPPPPVELPGVQVKAAADAPAPAQAPINPSKATASAGMSPEPAKAPEPGAKDAAHVAPNPVPDAPASPEGKPQQLLLTLTLNGEDRGLQFAMLEGKRVWIIATALSDLGPENANAGVAGVKTFRNKSFVDPTVRFPGATVALSDSLDKLTITLPGSAWAQHRILLNAQQAVVPLSSTPSAFLNYSVGGSDQLTGSAYVNTGVSWGRTSIQSSASWSAQLGWIPGPTHLDVDDPKHLRRWTVGDQNIYSTDGTGGGAAIAGFGVQRAFDLDPYLITLPQPNIAGVLQAPGTIEIYRNGMLVGQRAVPAGPFSLEQLGVGVGQNNVRVIIRDPFGGTKEINQSFYGVNNNLAKGLTEYAYQIGVASPQLGYIYDPKRPELMLRQRWGLSDWFTVGYRLEAERGLTNGGLSTDLRLPFGGVHLAGAASQDAEHGQGWGTNFNYTVSGSRWSFAIGGSKFSNNYRRLGDRLTEETIQKSLNGYNSFLPIDFTDPNSIYNPENPFSPFNPINGGTGSIKIPTPAELLASTRLKSQVYGTVGYSPLQRLLLQASYSRSSYADGRTDTVQSVGGSYDLSWASLYFGLENSNVQLHKDRSVTLSLTVPLGLQTATVNHITRSTGAVTSLDFQRSLPAGTGIGYNVHAEQTGNGTSENIDLAGQNRLGRINAQFYNSALGRSANVQLNGSIVFIDKELHFGQPLTGNGYALVRVGDDIKGVSVIRENQDVGKTGRSGSFLVNDLLPYQNNAVGFEQKDVPPSYTFKEAARVVNVPRAGGAVVDFNVHPLRAARGRFQVDGMPLNGGTIIKVLGESEGAKGKKKVDLTLDAPLGSKGNFFLEDLPQGRYEAQAVYEGRLAKCAIMVPATKAPIYDLKTIACSWAGDAPAAGVSPEPAALESSKTPEALAPASTAPTPGAVAPASASSAPAPAPASSAAPVSPSTTGPAQAPSGAASAGKPAENLPAEKN